MSQLNTPVKNPPAAPAPRVHKSGLLEKDAHTEKAPVLTPTGAKNPSHSPMNVVFGSKS